MTPRPDASDALPSGLLGHIGPGAVAAAASSAAPEADGLPLDALLSAIPDSLEQLSLLTPEELAAAARRRIEQVQAVFIESWPEALAALSVRQTRILLCEAETDALIALIAAWAGGGEGTGSSGPDAEVLSALEARLDAALAAYPDGAFVRLGSRSPKDSYVGLHEGFQCRSGKRALELFETSMERIYLDLSDARKAGYAPSIWLRQWLEIPAWAEFRCLVAGGAALGASQYDTSEGRRWPEIADRAQEVEAAIKAYLPRVLAALHLPYAVVDVAFVAGDLSRPVLLEVNPPAGLADPCLFREALPKEGSPFEFRYIGDGRAYRFARPRG